MDTENGLSERKSKSQRMESEPADYLPMLNVDTGYYDISRFVEILCWSLGYSRYSPMTCLSDLYLHLVVH